ncbi:dipeptide/tripeptide permease [Elusimicrobium simillimum]|uniref:MFS transporter n=1 Tax=Elusimicrobium simillimum TaxID=3143438 RepID=UPI003C6F997C
MSTNDTPSPQETTSIKEELKIIFSSSRAFWLVNLVNFSDGIAYFGILTLMTLFLGGTVGMGDAMAGVSVSTFTGLVTLFMFGGGFVTDKYGVRKALAIALTLLFTGRIILSLSALPAGMGIPQLGFVTSWIAIFIMALGSGILQPALYAGAKEYANPKVSAIAFSLIYAIMNLGIVCEHFISPFIRTNAPFIGNVQGLGWGIMGVYLVCTSITGLVLLAHMSLFTKKIESKYRLAVESDEAGKNITWKERFARMPFKDLRFMCFLLLLMPVHTLFAHQFLTIPDYVFRMFPQEVADKFEWISGLNPFIIVIFVPTIALFTRKINVMKMIIAGTTLSALTTFLLVSSSPSLAALLTYVVIFSLGEASWSSRYYEHISELAPVGQVGAYMGLAGIPWFLAKFTTGLYSGTMLTHFLPKDGPQDPATMWLVYAIIACITPIGLMLTKNWIENKKKHL